LLDVYTLLPHIESAGDFDEQPARLRRPRRILGSEAGPWIGALSDDVADVSADLIRGLALWTAGKRDAAVWDSTFTGATTRSMPCARYTARAIRTVRRFVRNRHSTGSIRPACASPPFPS
jgi:hypothetical protein